MTDETADATILAAENDALRRRVAELEAERMAQLAQQQQQQAALEAANRLNQDVIKSAHEGMIVYGPDLRYLVWNPCMERLSGRKADEVLGKHPLEVFPFLRDVGVLARLEEALAGTVPAPLEFQSNIAGTLNWLIDTSAPLRDATGQVVGVIATVQDHTEHRRSEDALRASQERLHLALKSGNLAVWDWNLQANEMAWDDEMLKLYGLTPERFPGGIEAWKQGLHPEDRARAIAECEAALKGTRDFDTEFRVLHPDGTVRHVKANGLVIRNQSGAPLRMLGLNQDITEGKRAEAELTQSEALMRTAIENLPLIFYMIDGEGIFRLSVGAGLKGLGLEQNQVSGLSAFEIYKDFPEITNALRKALAGHTATFESRVGGSSYSNICVPFRASDTGFRGLVAVALDITQSKQAEEEKAKLEDQLHLAQKMESVGRLAGGVAHDFNNMLGVILGHVELAMEQLDPAQPIRVDLEEIQKAARRSADLTRQLLAFARKQTVAPQVLDLNQTVERMLTMLRRLIGEDIDLAWKPNAALWPVNMDPSQIDQILANLCVNARDAIGDVGKITIETGNRTFDKDYCAQHAGYSEGEYVQIVVSDSGAGMDKETQAHLFEPFFTTKAVGKGTGLGLATVYGIVKQNNGFINVYSEPGHGTTFKLYLPRHGSAAKQEIASAARESTGGHEVILLVEDEQSILQMTKTILERRGYTVVAASTPGEAIQVAKAHPNGIQLLITDVVMPEMNGRDLAKNLLSLYPQMKRLFMSGYTANVIAHHGVLDRGVNFIQKPFSGKDLAAKVREALDG